MHEKKNLVLDKALKKHPYKNSSYHFGTDSEQNDKNMHQNATLAIQIQAEIWHAWNHQSKKKVSFQSSSCHRFKDK